MRNKILFLSLLTAFLFSGIVYANHGGGMCPKGSDQCSMKSRGSCHTDCDSPCPITKKFFKKSCFFLANKEELGLSEEQVQKIEDLKLQVKKGAIEQEAKMKIMMLNTEAALSKPKIDVEAMKAAIDEASAGFAASAKSMVDSYAQLKGVLTAEQMASAKKIWAAKEKGDDCDKDGKKS